jgi:S-adenosylmethionine:tRNA ribosyltransferase-isomerase
MDLTNKQTYFYHLPQELIAQTPASPRDSSRLLVFNKKTKQIEHKHFYDILSYLKSGDVLVVNTSRVLPARLFGIKQTTGAKIEVLLHKHINLTTWEVLLKPAKRVEIGTVIVFNDNLSGTITKKLEEGLCEIEFAFQGSFEAILDQIGSMPLPHYIQQKLTDKERYQTVYARQNGSSAAPTAGLHFTNELLQKIEQMGVTIVRVVLHVGLGTFRPVKEDDISKHKMHSEYFELSQQNADIINQAKQQGRRIIAVGTTSVRVLESTANELGFVEPKTGETNIFIHPPYKFKVVDALITNFHLPESTLIMLVCAFCGYQETMDLYNLAVSQQYRFFSFGDAMFLY